MTHPLHEVLEALEGVVRVADRATVEFDAARAAISQVRLLMQAEQLSGHPAATNRTLPAAPQLDTPCAIEAERAPVDLSDAEIRSLARAELRGRSVSPNDLNGDLRCLQGMADEYQAWIEFFHAGDGDYDDFLRQRLKDTQ